MPWRRLCLHKGGGLGRNELGKCVMGASIIVIGLTGGSLGSRHGETVQMYIVAIMIELKSTFSCLLGYLLFNYLSLCPQLSCMHCNINPNTPNTRNGQ